MADEEFTCEKFQPQKWRRDVCRNCYQPMKLCTGRGGGGGGGKKETKEAKVFQRFRANKETAVDSPVSPVEKVHQSRDEVGTKTLANPSPSPPSSTTPSIISKSPSPGVSMTTETHVPPVAQETMPVGVGNAPRSSVSVRVPSRPPPPASVIAKPPPPATVGGTTHRPLVTKLSSPVSPGTTVVQHVVRQPDNESSSVGKSNKSSQENNSQKLAHEKPDSNTLKELESKTSENIKTTPDKVSESEVGGAMGMVSKDVEEGRKITAEAKLVEEVVEAVEISESSQKLENSVSTLHQEEASPDGEERGRGQEEGEGGEIEPSVVEEGEREGEASLTHELVKEESHVIELVEEEEKVKSCLKFVKDQLQSGQNETEKQTTNSIEEKVVEKIEEKTESVHQEEEKQEVEEVTELAVEAALQDDKEEGKIVVKEKEEEEVEEEEVVEEVEEEVEEEENEEEGTDSGTLKKIKKRLSIKKKSKKSEVERENSVSSTQEPGHVQQEVSGGESQQPGAAPPAPPPPSGPPPPPPPPPPPVAPPPPPLALPGRRGRPVRQQPADGGAAARAATMAAIQEGVTLRRAPQPPERPGPSLSLHDQAMDSIKKGVALKATPRPQERPPGEERVVDFASELRLKMMKQRKQESQGVMEKVQEQREDIQKMIDAILVRQGSPSFVNQLRGLLEQITAFFRRTNLTEEVLQQKAQWPAQQVADLREVLSYVDNMESKIRSAQTLCEQTMQGAVAQWRVNSQAVERCVNDVVKIAKELDSGDSRFFLASRSFPLDRADLRSLVSRAGDAVSPLLDKLYEKALQSHQAIFDPTASKYDLGFRLQSALRLLRMCCNMSDTLSTYVSVPRHPSYSEAQLKCQELESEFNKTMNVLERKGEWDTDETETLQLQNSKKSSEVKGETAAITSLLEGVAKGGAELEKSLAELNEETYFKIEVQLIKAAVSSANEKVIDDVMALRDKFSSNDDATRHRRDFDWLLESVTKGRTEVVCWLVQKHGLPVNCSSSDAGNTVLHRAVQRQDFAMMSQLIKLGADPLAANTAGRTPVQLLALKCFPPKHIREVEEKEPLFDLSSYINSPNLSDVVLVTSDEKRYNAHRLVLCAQSPVLKSMLDSDLWTESKNKEIPMPMVSGRVLQVVLEYLYTGRCLFPPDDLNLGIEVLVAADQLLLEPMKRKCEKVLSDKIDAEVAVPMYQAAYHYSAPQLLACSSNYLLLHYKEIQDTGHEALLQLLQNQSPSSS